MFQGFYPRYDLEARIQHTKMDPGVWDIPSARMSRIEDHEGQDFKSVMSGLVENFNQTLEAPDNLLRDAMMGSENVDIHDVMTAMNKAELSVTMVTTMTTKVISAYDKIMQITM